MLTVHTDGTVDKTELAEAVAFQVDLDIEDVRKVVRALDNMGVRVVDYQFYSAAFNARAALRSLLREG
jgi:hydrogenase maturation factor HypE